MKICQPCSWYFEQSELDVTVTPGNTELPKNAFIVSGFDVRGRISNDGQTLQNVEFVLFNQKNVCIIIELNSKCFKNFEKKW